MINIPDPHATPRGSPRCGRCDDMIYRQREPAWRMVSSPASLKALRPLEALTPRHRAVTEQRYIVAGPIVYFWTQWRGRGVNNHHTQV